MFDLFRSRDRSVRILLGVILGIVAISMVTYLIPGSGQSGFAANDDNLLAKVGDERITTQNAMQAISMQMRGRQIPPEMMSFIAPQVVNQLVNERTLAYEAKRQGIRVSDDDVAAGVRSQLPPSFFDKDGKINQDQLAGALSAQNMTVPQFVDEMRRSLLVQRLRQIVLDSIVVTKTDVENEYRQRNEKIKVEYALVKPAMLEQQVQVTPADIEAYFNKNRQTYQTPEKKSLAIVFLDTAKVEQGINAPESELRSVYGGNQERFRSPERVKVRHILLKTDAAKKNDAAVEAKANDVLKQLKGGADFAELAKKNSEDPGSASKGGDLDFISRGQTVKPFEDAAFSLKPGELSGLVKTLYGYHILQVQDKEAARVKPFEEVKGTLEAEYKKRKANDSMQQMADRARAGLRKDPAHPEKAAQDASGELIRVENIKPGDPLPQIGVSNELTNAIAGLKKGDVSQVITIPPARLAVAEVTGVTAAHPATLDEVRPQVEAAVRKQKVDELAQKRVADLLAKAKANGNDLAKAAKELGLEVKTSTDFNRQGAVEGFGSANLLGEAFTAKDGALIGPVTSADGKAIVKVLSHTPANMAEFASTQGALKDELKNKLSTERFGLFEAGLRKKLEKDGKVRIQEAAMTRLLQGMRS